MVVGFLKLSRDLSFVTSTFGPRVDLFFGLMVATVQDLSQLQGTSFGNAGPGWVERYLALS
jgi:hypothetical protein